MKTLVWLLLAVMLVVPSAGALAQPLPDTELVDTVVPVEAIGTGWELAHSEASESRMNVWNFRANYDGPDGARIEISAIYLGETLGSVVLRWGNARQFFATTAEREAIVPDPLAEGIGHGDIALPDGASDGLRIEGSHRESHLTTGIGLYGSLAGRVAIVVVAMGTVNGLAGVPAADYIAGLYFAAQAG